MALGKRVIQDSEGRISLDAKPSTLTAIAEVRDSKEVDVAFLAPIECNEQEFMVSHYAMQLKLRERIQRKYGLTLEQIEQMEPEEQRRKGFNAVIDVLAKAEENKPPQSSPSMCSDNENIKMVHDEPGVNLAWLAFLNVPQDVQRELLVAMLVSWAMQDECVDFSDKSREDTDGALDRLVNDVREKVKRPTGIIELIEQIPLPKGRGGMMQEEWELVRHLFRLAPEHPEGESFERRT